MPTTHLGTAMSGPVTFKTVALKSEATSKIVSMTALILPHQQMTQAKLRTLQLSIPSSKAMETKASSEQKTGITIEYLINTF